MTRRDCTAPRTDEAHLFVCPDCRADARISAAWKAIPLGETPRPADDGFVGRVVRRARDQRARAARRRFWLAAAAAALFFFFAGFAHESIPAPAAGAAEESYATLAAPNALDGLLPN
jgi:hypothetical protein